jgi:hypothetical protein
MLLRNLSAVFAGCALLLPPSMQPVRQLLRAYLIGVSAQARWKSNRVI